MKLLVLVVSFVIIANIAANEQRKRQREKNNPLRISSGDIQLKTLNKKTKLFKSAPMYTSYNPRQKVLELYRKQQDWSGQYFGFVPEVAESYGTDYLSETTRKGGFYIYKFEVKDNFEILVNRNRRHGDSALSGNLKSQALKKFFKEHGLGKIEDQDFYPQYNTRQVENHFYKLSNDLKSEFSNDGAVLLDTLDRLNLGFQGPHDAETHNDELILLSRTVGKLKEVGMPSVVVRLSDVSDDIKYATYSDVPQNYRKLIYDNYPGLRIVDYY